MDKNKIKMSMWWNGRHACLRNKYRKMCRFESDLGHKWLVGATGVRHNCLRNNP